MSEDGWDEVIANLREAREQADKARDSAERAEHSLTEAQEQLALIKLKLKGLLARYPAQESTET